MSYIFIGEPIEVKEGQIFPKRTDLIKANLHRFTMHGIDADSSEGASAIVLSGGYEDDIDYGDEIIYTGEGGNDIKTKKQIDHQSFESRGNKGLVISKENALPVRVIRSYKHKSALSPSYGYKYGGLYRVIECYKEIGKSGFKVCRFRLIKETSLDNEVAHTVKEGTLVYLKPNGKEAKWISIGAFSKSAQVINSESKFAQALIGKKKGEKVGFGNGFEIIEIKKYMSK